jgi:hypothetical protein
MGGGIGDNSGQRVNTALQYGSSRWLWKAMSRDKRCRHEALYYNRTTKELIEYKLLENLYMRTVVLMPLTTKNAVFRDVMPCGLEAVH